MVDLTIFSWGYFGWGNATRQLVGAVDAIEAQRGFDPPLFVDVRISRSVRALGFRERAFEELLGRDRYRWMHGLGNLRIKSHSGPAIQIADPNAAAELLSLAVEMAKQSRRLLFFCSCELPFDDSGTPCHRVKVGLLLVKEARKQGVPLTLVEWPGDEPTEVAIEVSAQLLRAVSKGRKSVLLNDTSIPAGPVRLAVGSIATLRQGGDMVRIVTGPARYGTDGWYLPVLKSFAPAHTSVEAARSWSADYREQHGFEPVEVVAADRGNRALTDARHTETKLCSTCVYTIVQIDRLRDFAARGGVGAVSERRPWTSAERLLKEAHAAGLRLPVIFADAADCTRLHYWALLTTVNPSSNGTTFAFEQMQPLPSGHTPQELILRSTGRPIAPGFIRPYAICRTPGFLRSAE